MSTQDKAERTIKATQRKRLEARREGNLPRSREMPNIATFIGALVLIFFFGGLGVNGLVQMMRKMILRAGQVQVNDASVGQIFWDAAGDVAVVLGPLLLTLLLVALAFSVLFQGGWNLSSKAFKFQPSKFSPVKGLKRMLMSKTAMANFVRTIIIILIVVYITLDTLVAEYDRLPGLIMMPLPQALAYTSGFIFAALFKIALLFVVVAVLDLAWSKYQYEERLKMTPREFKDELKTTEGDPKIKRRIRTVQYQMFRRRMMAAVPEADVVITNPTHYAVALAYEGEKAVAPEVVAKGRGYLAEKIREVAEEHGVPLVENAILARALYSSCEIGDLIPPDLYRAVAEVLAYVYRLKDKVPA